MFQHWGWASVLCSKCGRVLQDVSLSRAEEVAICPACGNLFSSDDAGAKANGPLEKSV